MKLLATVLVTLMATTAMAKAAPTPFEINSKALEILLQNSGKLKSAEGETVASILAGFLPTGEVTHNKISNTCAFDKDDEAFKCSLVISNADDSIEDRTESATEIRYQLEKDSNGLPSNELFYLSVDVMVAG